MALKTEQLKCVDKFRNKNNKIIGYRLLDIYGKTHDMKADALKYAISKNLIRVTNLTLTSDNRLVNTQEKQLQSKQLGPEPQIETGTSKMEEFMLQVAKTIFKKLRSNIEVEDIREIDNSYDGMIDKRYDIKGHYMYFDEDTSMLSITYYDKDYEGTDKPEFWLAIEVYGEEVSSVHEIKAESMSKDDIKNVIDEFIREVKPHISIY